MSVNTKIYNEEFLTATVKTFSPEQIIFLKNFFDKLVINDDFDNITDEEYKVLLSRNEDIERGEFAE